MRNTVSTCAGVLLLAVTAAVAPAQDRPLEKYPREHVYDTTVGPDEAIVNVSLVSNRWPDCTTMESAIASIFRIEGVNDKPDQDKAFALWKWYRILMSATGGYYAYEGPKCDKLVWGSHKIFTVYGHHQCDGLSWAMAPLWRAAGYMAFDEASHGHTTASLRYHDADGVLRYHSFDPQLRFYYWDPAKKHVSVRTLPVMGHTVMRHMTAPRHLHILLTSLRWVEKISRNWQNTGHGAFRTSV